MPLTLPFAHTEPCTLLCDTSEVAAAAVRLGWPDVRRVDRLDPAVAPPDVALLLTTNPETLHDEQLQRLLATSRVLYLGLQAFDASLRAAVYTLATLRRCDFAAAVRRNCRWLRRLAREQTLCFASGPSRQARLSVVPADEVDFGTVDTAELAPGSLIAAGAYFEVELEGFGSAPRPFRVDGELVADGVLYALADDFPGDRGVARARGQRAFAAAQPGGLALRVEENRVVACRAADGRSLLPALAAATDGNLTLTECSIGTNRLRRPDFSINAQINEGAGGIHVGLGGGEQGLHLDFIASRAVWLAPRPTPAAYGGERMKAGAR